MRILFFAFLFACLPPLPALAEEEGMAFADMAEGFRKHCVRVFIRAKAHDGEPPPVGDFGADMLHERPTLVGGYWWDERHVLIHDPVLPDHFIRSVEIAPPDDETRHAATVAGHFTHMDALLLEVLPDASGKLPESHPLPFVEGDINEALILSYGHESGEWRLTLESESGIGDISFSDAGEETAALAAQGVMLTPEGEVFALSFGGEIALTGENAALFGPETVESPFFRRRDAEALRSRLRERLSGAVLETAVRIRISVDEDGDESDGVLALANDLLPDGSAELRAAGLVVGERTLLVPAPLPPEGIARIGEIRVTAANGEAIPARFAGALRRYMAILVETDRPLPAADLPPGFSLLNPASPPEAAEYPLPSRAFFLRHRIDYSLGRRREETDYDRWVGLFRGYRDDPVVQTRTSEQDAALAFDTDGRLVALALTPRLLEDGAASFAASPAFRPVPFLGRQLRAHDALDPSLRPREEDEGERLVDFGVEFQPLDANTARLFDAARETRGGDIGLLVTHVYPGSIADSLGLREHDVLLRFFLEGRSEPMELRSESSPHDEGMFGADMSREDFQRLLRHMPPPWPPRENAVSTLLTGVGAGKPVEVEYLREGELRRALFETGFFEPDYRSARRERFPLLGVTARPLTYEVRRFFNREQGGGVVVSRVEEGSKASVAGLHPYLLVTRVDAREVKDLDDFAARVRDFEDGAAPSVELTVESFGKTRLVKIE